MSFRMITFHLSKWFCLMYNIKENTWCYIICINIMRIIIIIIRINKWNYNYSSDINFILLSFTCEFER